MKRMIIWTCVLLIALAGCASMFGVKPTGHTNPIDIINKQAAEISALMGWVSTLAMLAIGIGITLGIYLKTNLGPAIAIGAGAVLILSLFVKSSAWFMPYLALAIAVLGLVFFAIRFWKTGSWRDAFHG